MHSLHKIRRFTICRTPVVNEPFGMHECIPCETSRQISIRCGMERPHGGWGLWHIDGIVFDIILPRKAGSAILCPELS